MKKLALLLVVVLLAACGCASQYVVKLSNGRQITTPHKPKLKGAYYVYKDAGGQENYIPQSRVREIEPASMAAKESKFEVSKPNQKHWYWPF